MGDGSRRSLEVNGSSIVQSLIKEWSLFWASITEDLEQENGLEIPDERLQSLTLEQVQAMMKALSFDRKTLHQKMETLNEELEEENSRLQTIQMTKGNTSACLARIDELHDMGQALGEALEKIDARIREARAREQILIEEKATL